MKDLLFMMLSFLIGIGAGLFFKEKEIEAAKRQALQEAARGTFIDPRLQGILATEEEVEE